MRLRARTLAELVASVSSRAYTKKGYANELFWLSLPVGSTPGWAQLSCIHLQKAGDEKITAMDG
jgi:hypothetical protein